MTIDDLTTTCTTCDGSGKHPEDVAQNARMANPAPFGRRELPVSIRPCPAWYCKGGKVPSETGRLILEFVQAHARS